MPLERAVREGYTFTLDTYRDEIMELTDRRSSNRYMELLVQYLQMYPDLYDAIDPMLCTNLRPHPRYAILVKRILQLHYPEGIKDVYQYLHAYLFNEPIDVPEPEDVRKRRMALESLPWQWQRAVLHLYDVESISRVLDLPEHAMEKYILRLSRLDRGGLLKEAQTLGMYIPDLDHAEWYVSKYIRDYTKVFSRPADLPSIFDLETIDADVLAPYTDMELLDLFGWTREASFENRGQYIRANVYRLHTPLLRVYSKLPRDKSTLPPPYLVYGTCYSYTVLDLDNIVRDLVPMGMGYANKTGLPTYDLLYALEKFALRDVTGYYRKTIVEALRRMCNIRCKEPRVLRAIESLRNTPVYKGYLHQVYDFGMYIRGWKGPGHPYPIAKASTPEVRETCEIRTPDEYISLPVIVYRSTGVYSEHTTLDQLVEMAREDPEKRYYGTMLIYTAGYYLEEAYGTKMHDVDQIGDLW